MPETRNPPVLAVGIDAAEPTLVRELIERGEMPTMGGLLDGGRWALVDSRADIGSGAVWPTFFTGTDPTEHQMYSGWVWQPGAMACTAPDEGRLTPFWGPTAQNGAAVGVMDVPWAPVLGVERGFEVSEWGPHDVARGEPLVGPSAVEEVVARSERHPFYRIQYGPGYADDPEGKRRLSSACVAGARLRGELAARLIEEHQPALSIVGFTEVHHTTHQLWHTVAADDPMYAAGALPNQGEVKPDLVDLFREVDRQIGRIIDAAEPDTAVMVFSLHGMQPGVGIPMVHNALLEGLGFAVPSRWRGLSWRQRGAAVFGATKRHAPASLRALYHRRTSMRARHRIAQPTVVQSYDWSRTRAFSLPTDQRGYIRVNLAGREAQGIVPEAEYESACDEVEAALRAAESVDGEPLVAGVLRPAEQGGGPPEHLPDLVVDWAKAAFARPVRVAIGSREIEVHPIRTDMTGQHSRHGFCILDESLADSAAGELVAGKDLHRVLVSGVEAKQAAPQE